MNLRPCDCCGKSFKELSGPVTVGAHKQQWFVCGPCLNNVVPRIPKDTEVPLLSTLFNFSK